MVSCLVIIIKYRGNKLYLNTSSHRKTLFNRTYGVVTIIVLFFKLAIPKPSVENGVLVCLLVGSFM